MSLSEARSGRKCGAVGELPTATPAPHVLPPTAKRKETLRQTTDGGSSWRGCWSGVGAGVGETTRGRRKGDERAAKKLVDGGDGTAPKTAGRLCASAAEVPARNWIVVHQRRRMAPRALESVGRAAGGKSWAAFRGAVRKGATWEGTGKQVAGVNVGRSNYGAATRCQLFRFASVCHLCEGFEGGLCRTKVNLL